MAVLLDTTVASLLHPSKRLLPLREQYDVHLAGEMRVVSFQTEAELFYWATAKNWGLAQWARLENLISEFVIVPYDASLGRVWAHLMSQARKQGNRLEAGDAWIAATAVHRHIPLITYDRDFTRLHLRGLKVICHA